MAQSVAKHRYWSGRDAVKAVSEYANYLKYREGEDKQKGGRTFFDAEKDQTDKDLREEVRNLKSRGAAAHELILSPGLNTVDPMAYTRELMEKLERSKGQELNWVAVAHSNTEHNHIHVLISGESKERKPVLLRKDDHANLREWGDKYIEREHYLERYLDREVERGLDRGFEYDKGDELFNRLLYGIKGGKEQEKDKPKARTERVERKPEEWKKEKAVAELADDEKIVTSQGEVLSQFSKVSELKEFCHRLSAGQEKRLSREQYKKLWSWMGTKEKAGDDYYERKEKEKEKRKRQEKDKSGKVSQITERREYSKKSARESRRHYLDYSKKPRSQRMFEQRGRELEQYTYAQLTMERSRLNLLIASQPEKREVFERQLEELEGFKREIEKDFEKVDLDDIMGWKKGGPEKGKGHSRDKDGEEKGEQEKEEERQEQERQQAEAQAQAQQSEQAQQQQREQMSQGEEANKAAGQSREQQDKETGRGEDDLEREMYGR